jgi:hypothetical protein
MQSACTMWTKRCTENFVVIDVCSLLDTRCADFKQSQSAWEQAKEVASASHYDESTLETQCSTARHDFVTCSRPCATNCVRISFQRSLCTTRMSLLHHDLFSEGASYFDTVQGPRVVIVARPSILCHAVDLFAVCFYSRNITSSRPLILLRSFEECLIGPGVVDWQESNWITSADVHMVSEVSIRGLSCLHGRRGFYNPLPYCMHEIEVIACAV